MADPSLNAVRDLLLPGLWDLAKDGDLVINQNRETIDLHRPGKPPVMMVTRQEIVDGTYKVHFAPRLFEATKGD